MSLISVAFIPEGLYVVLPTINSCALMNLPDTFSTARLRPLLEAHGSIEKITLRPDHNGAIIVFSSAADAGKAALSLEGHEIVPGRHVHIGTVSELKKTKAEIKEANPGVKKVGSTTAKADSSSNGNSSKPRFLPNAGPIHRPGLGSAARRGGHLGKRKGPPGVGGFGVGGTNGVASDKSAENANGTGKSNDEFRKLFEASTSKADDNAKE